ncbi:MAG: hypothetical protein RBR93_09100 [Aliarcobacter butzleri]|nr:hypothetical protein [Aliarcobacter butzleri]
MEQEKINQTKNEKVFSEAEIKKRLKNKSKSDLVQIIIYLSKRVDELKEKENENVWWKIKCILFNE